MNHVLYVNDLRVCNPLFARLLAWHWRKRGLTVVDIPFSPWRRIVGVVSSESHAERDRD